ncbi:MULTISPECIES: GPW/gp25 family protein [Tenacibaculum]|uniref:GPW/gp25 family protein n=1 Tax=Tenacibaculum discolor TaxID=361581 RepID=A0A2G1BTC0_9FLAO|nr:GPW/gp25 family protein [Tenacibaculum discolor]MDP2542576.1 GPW/gp25 family protein [Tenacibaculum discolor]PHN97287.1 lysozyme [Tenacibaculum discolor]PHO00296.1 lysozyme [Rhodobacteraceae bacterium 4F10]RLJ98649.1 phage baseplate assembly protein W [Tenacibaculum discolor]
MNYLKIPLDFSSITKRNKENNRLGCTLEESIAQHLMIIATSKQGEVFGRPNYGSDIWDLEFNQLVKINKWEEKVKDSLYYAFIEYEPRLKDIRVSVRLSEIDDDAETTDVHVRRKAEIKVFGTIIETEAPFNFATLFYISPLSQ